MKIKTVPFYTDGSKSDTYVSSSAVFPVDIFKVNLHEHASIFTAEAVALQMAVQHDQREAKWVSEWIICLTSQLTIFQSYMWRHIDVQADWRSLTYGRASTP